MRVILPDSSELELPEGATGLDAARATGPKLAGQAVLVRANGSVRAPRLPLDDGERIQILTTRDREDADALFVLRHSAAHLLAEAARRLYPGTKVAIGPPIENGFYYDFVDLCRGPHLQNAKPIKAFKLLSLAGAYWRGDETRPQLTRVYGTAFYDLQDLEAYLHRLEEAKRRDHRVLGVQLDLVHLSDEAPGMPFWHPKGMVIWNTLEDLRRRENASRGYVEVKTPLMYDIAVWQTSGHWEKFRENMFLVPYGEDRVLGLKPMNCPGHMLLFGSA